MKDVIFECPECRQALEAPGDMVGLFVECPKCWSVIKVPKTQNASSLPPKESPSSSPVKEDKVDDDSLKGSTIRIELPPNLGIPEAPKRKITIRRKP